MKWSIGNVSNYQELFAFTKLEVESIGHFMVAAPYVELSVGYDDLPKASVEETTKWKWVEDGKNPGLGARAFYIWNGIYFGQGLVHCNLPDQQALEEILETWDQRIKPDQMP